MSAVASLAAELRAISQFADLPADALEWLSAHMELVKMESGQLFFEPGAPADRMAVILEGAIRAQAEGGVNDGRVFVSQAGMITGLLPYSRLTVFPLAVRAVGRTRVATLHKEFSRRCCSASRNWVPGWWQ